MKTAQEREAFLSSLTLLGSMSTLICCALPAMFVTIGAGATLAGFVTAFPQLVFLSEYKVAVFALSGGLLALSAAFRYLNRNAPCPADPTQAATCQRLRRFGGVVLYCSVAVYFVGFFFAFLAAILISD
jgi:hypothetical protein